jgi:hypothetical protein
VLDESRAIPVPADISDQLVLLVILACDAAKGVAKLDLHIDDAVLIAGAGTVGLLTLFNLRPRDQSDIACWSRWWRGVRWRWPLTRARRSTRSPADRPMWPIAVASSAPAGMQPLARCKRR